MAGRTDHSREADAVEYVLGTSSAAERRTVERDMASDPALAEAVRTWEDRLAPLADLLPGIVPAAERWPALLAAIEADSAEAGRAPVQRSRTWEQLRRSRSLWRGAALAASALAASLAVALGLTLASPREPALVGVVNRSGDLPALIVRVDLAAGTIQVRSVEAEIPAGRSLELWSIAAGASPHSLGLVAGRKTLRSLTPGERAGMSGASLAVSVEPEGGSKTGQPTGPVIYQGKLLTEE